MLDQFDTMLLRVAAQKTLPRPLRSWKSCKRYEALAEQGLVTEIPSLSPFHKQFQITDAGRSALWGRMTLTRA